MIKNRILIDRKLVWLVSGVFLFVIGSILFTYIPRPSSHSQETRWLYVEPQILENQLGLIGRIEAGEHMVLTAPFEAIVKELDVTPGQLVKRGQKLLTLDTSQLDIQIREALAVELKARRAMQDMQNWQQSEEVSRARRALANARLNLEDTEAKLADTRRLFQRGIVARMEVDSQEQQAKTQRLDLVASQAELRAAEERGKGENLQIAEMELANAQARHQALLTLHKLRELSAPFDGIILPLQSREDSNDRPAIQSGVHVSQGTPLFELASIEQIKAVARIEEADLHQIGEGMTVQVSGDGFANIALTGVVTNIGVQGITPAAYGGGTSYEVLVTINPLTSEQKKKIRLGMSARLVITTYRVDGGFAVPVEALHQDSAGNTIVKYRQNMDEASQILKVVAGKAVLQGVEIFGLTQQGYVEAGL